MMQVVPKWQVTVTKSDGSLTLFWMHDNFLANVVRKVADMQFENGIAQPKRIVIEPAPVIEQIGVTMGGLDSAHPMTSAQTAEKGRA